jgi:hypothetical protein
MTTHSDARNILRSALATLQSARAALGEAEQVASRAAEDMNKSTNSLKSFDGLDEEFAKARIEALKRGAWTGYPKALQAKRLERMTAQEDAEHARHASEILNAQMDDARSDVVVAEREVDEAAAVAFCEQVHDVVRQLEQANQHCEFLHRVLRGSCLPFGGPGWDRLLPNQRTYIMATEIRGAGLPAGTLAPWRDLHAAAYNAVYSPRTSGEVNAEASAAYWQAFAKAIVNGDADAEAGPLPSPDSVLSAK